MNDTRSNVVCVLHREHFLALPDRFASSYRERRKRFAAPQAVTGVSTKFADVLILIYSFKSLISNFSPAAVFGLLPTTVARCRRRFSCEFSLVSRQTRAAVARREAAPARIPA